jgi:hypothetical protein
MRRAVLAAAFLLWAAHGSAQTFSQRGFLEGRAFFFPQEATNDTTRLVGDFLGREELFWKPAEWVQFAAGGDLRANSHDQVEPDWSIDFKDRTILRPRVAIRRLSASVTKGGFALDAGKQFIRWGRTDVLTPTDRFAPRDYLNVLDAEFLPIFAVRPSFQVGTETLEAVWQPYLTPSRMPLFDQRWTVFPPEAEGIPILDGGLVIPERSLWGFRWRHTGEAVELSASYFDGVNHLPTVLTEVFATPAIALTRVFPEIRSYGGDIAIPTSALTLKGEVAYFDSPSDTSEEYVLYVIEIERQVGEWIFVVGYAGDVATETSPEFQFAPDRGTADSILGRASYTVDPRRTVAIEGAVRQNGDGFYVKGEFSEAFGQHLRLTVTGVGLGGEETDFLGQYQRNSHVSAGLRFSF